MGVGVDGGDRVDGVVADGDVSISGNREHPALKVSAKTRTRETARYFIFILFITDYILAY
jgi:hypothetical protein